MKLIVKIKEKLFKKKELEKTTVCNCKRCQNATNPMFGKYEKPTEQNDKNL